MSDLIINIDQESPSRAESSALTRRAMELLGGKNLGRLFAVKIDSAPAVVSAWIKRASGPLFWMRRFLIELEKEGGGKLVEEILIYLCRPFNLQPTRIPDKRPSFLSMLRSLAAQGKESADVHTIFAAIAEDGKLAASELRKMQAEIEEAIRADRALLDQVEFLRAKAEENGGAIEIEESRTQRWT
ncbi:MAG: hypothetical protein AB1656_04965 [Candidatus Omnitrophota bacterium]